MTRVEHHCLWLVLVREFQLIVIGEFLASLDVPASDDKYVATGCEMCFTVSLTAMINSLCRSSIYRCIDIRSTTDTEQKNHRAAAACPPCFSLVSRDAFAGVFDNASALLMSQAAKPPRPAMGDRLTIISSVRGRKLRVTID